MRRRQRSLASADFTPRSIAGCVAWFAARKLSLNDGDAVATWPDLVAGVYTLGQATGSKQPLFKTNQVNGQPCVRPDAVDDFLQSTPNFPLTGNLETTVFIVFKPAALSALGVWGWGDHSTALGNFGQYNLLSGNEPDIAYAGGNTYQPAANLTAAWQMYSFHKSPGAINTTSSSYRNGVSQTQVGAPVTTPNVLANPLFLFKWGTIASVYSNCDIAEFIVYSRDLGASERSRIERYLGAIYGISVP